MAEAQQLDQGQAIDLITGKLAPETAQPPEPPAEEPVREPEPQEDAPDSGAPEPAPEGDDAPDQAAEAQEVEAEPSDETPEQASEGEDWDWSVQSLAEAYGMSPQEVSEKLQVERRVNGKTETIPLAQALQDHQQRADYIEKTQALSQARQEFKAERERAQAAIVDRVQQLDTAIMQLQAQVETAPDPQTLMSQFTDEMGDFDQAGYLAALERVNAQQQALQYAQVMRAEEARQGQELQMQAIEDWKAEQAVRLGEIVPELSGATPATLTEKYGKGLESYGFTGDEAKAFFDGPYDARQVSIIKDALEMRALREQSNTGKKELRGKPKFVKPGTTEQAVVDKSSQLRKRLSGAQTRHTQRDAALDVIRDKLG